MTAADGPPKDPDSHKGAIEGDQVDHEQHANRNADGGEPDALAIEEDRIGPNVDDSEVSHASETGASTDTLRDEEQLLE